MRRSSRDNVVCFESLEQALEERPETYGHLDLIAFGFPCQDISNANPKGEGLEGKRSSIFFECMRIVDILNPTWLLIENVPRLLSIHKGRDFAVVLQTLSESGYGFAWRILDSRYFGVAQRRRRVFIVGYFGGTCPAEILFEPKGGGRYDPKKRKIWQGGLCISTRDGWKRNPTSETYIASTIQSTDEKLRKFGFGENLVTSTIQANRPYNNKPNDSNLNLVASAVRIYPEEKLPPSRNRQTNLVAQTIGGTARGNAGRIWEDTHIAEINPNGKRETPGTPRGLDSHRGILIGNAVTVQVAHWIAKRIYEYETKTLLR